MGVGNFPDDIGQLLINLNLLNSICYEWNFPVISTDFKFYNFWQSQADSRLNGKFTNLLETNLYFLADFQIVFSTSKKKSGFSFDLSNNFAIFRFFTTELPVLSNCDVLQCWALNQIILLFQILWKLYSWAGKLIFCLENFQNVFNTNQLLSRFPCQFQQTLATCMDLPDFQTDLPDLTLGAFGCHCFQPIFRIVGNLPGSIATMLPGF